MPPANLNLQVKRLFNSQGDTNCNSREMEAMKGAMCKTYLKMFLLSDCLSETDVSLSPSKDLYLLWETELIEMFTTV